MVLYPIWEGLDQWPFVEREVLESLNFKPKPQFIPKKSHSSHINVYTGKIDLLTGEDGKLEVLDFKTSPKPDKDAPILDSYFKQLCVYAHILEQRYGKHPERLYIYWTAEKTRQDALTEFPFTKKDIQQAEYYFDAVVGEIQQKKFDMTKQPDKTKICLECDFGSYCAMEGTI